MSILDDAIKEHLELKRQHGADESELKQLEDEAFGPPERPGDGDSAPDPLAEAPTEFMATPDLDDEVAPADEDERPQRHEIADLQEAPEPIEESSAQEPESAEESEPAVEEQPAMEHEIVPESPGPSTEERQAMADQPTEMFDVAAELASEDSAPSDEQLVEEEMSEPRLAPVDPLAGQEIEEEDEADDEDDEFWDEQRLSDELNQALEGPPSEESEPEAKIEIEEVEVEEVEIVEEPEEEQPQEEGSAPGQADDEDILEDTPEFLEDSEDDQLWFEQKPPKDFDFDD